MSVESDADRPVHDAERIESERENRFYDDSVLSVVAHDEYDARAYSETLQLSSRLPGAIARAEQRLPTAAALVEDIFYSVYQPAPTLRTASEVPLSATVNRTILEQLLGTTEWDALRRAGTIGDQFASALAAAAVGPGLAATLDQATLDRLGQLHDAELAAERLFAEAEALDDLAAARGDSGSDLYVRARVARQHATARQREAVELAGQIETDVETIEDATRRAGRTSLRAAEQEIEVMLTAIKTYTGGYAPGVDSGAGSPTVTLSDKLLLATRLGQSHRLKQVAELCGRLTRIALQVQRSKVQHPPDEIVGITIGGDLSRMLPVELGLLSDPALEDAWHLKHIDKRLMELEMIGSERQGRGPIIVALDSSASMSDHLGSPVTKEAWSKAVALALLAIARKQRRDVAILHFSGSGQLNVFQFREGRATPSELIATTEWFYAGGTVYDEWMAETLRLIDASRFDRADVVCLSDGEVSVSAALEGEWNRRRLARGMRCYSVLLGDDTGATALARVSDALVTLADLTDDDAVVRTLFAI